MQKRRKGTTSGSAPSASSRALEGPDLQAADDVLNACIAVEARRFRALCHNRSCGKPGKIKQRVRLAQKPLITSF